MVAIQHHIASEVLLWFKRSIREDFKSTVAAHPPLVRIESGLRHDDCISCIVTLGANNSNESMRVCVLERSTARGLLLIDRQRRRLCTATASRIKAPDDVVFRALFAMEAQMRIVCHLSDSDHLLIKGDGELCRRGRWHGNRNHHIKRLDVRSGSCHRAL